MFASFGAFYRGNYQYYNLFLNTLKKMIPVSIAALSNSTFRSDGNGQHLYYPILWSKATWGYPAFEMWLVLLRNIKWLI